MVLIGVQENVANMMKNYRSMYTLKTYKKYLKFLGICPFSLGSNRWISKIHSISVMVIFMANSLWVGMQQTLFSHHEMNIFEIHLEMSAFLVPCLLYGNVLYTNLKRSESWSKIFSNLSEFDRRFQNNKLFSTMRTSGFLKIAFLNLILITIPSIITLLMIHGSPDLPLHKIMTVGAANQISYLYEFNIAGFIWELSCVIESRYFHVMERIQTIITQRKFINIYKLDKELQNIIHLYKLLYFCTVELSVIFGKTILFCLINSVAIFLDNFYWMMVSYTKLGKTELIYIEFLYLLSVLVSIFFCQITFAFNIRIIL